MSLRSLLFSILLLRSWIIGTKSEGCPCEEAATSEITQHISRVCGCGGGGGMGGFTTKEDSEKANDEMMKKLCEILDIITNISEKIKDDEKTGLDKCRDEALQEYKTCLEMAEPEIQNWVEEKNKEKDPEGDWKNVPEEVRCCLTIMYCNVGSDYFNKFSNMRNAIAAGNWEEAAKELRKSDWHSFVNNWLAEKLAKKLEDVPAVPP